MVLGLAMPVVSFAQGGAKILAQGGAGVAIVVNERAISYSDLENRTSLIIASSGLPNTPETRQRLGPQIISSLVDEALQMQEAEKLEIEIDQEAINSELAVIAKSNNMTADQFRGVLAQNNVSVQSLYDQIEARLAWAQVFAAKLQKQAQITDSDVDSYMEYLQGQVGKTEYLLSEIFLPIETIESAEDVRQLADKVWQDLSSGQVPFVTVARQLSKAPGAQNGGSLGWVQANQLDDVFVETVQNLGKKGLSKPVKSITGYHIFYLQAKRTISEENIPERAQVQNSLFQKRAEQVAQSYLQSLRQSAFIENRL